jgi:hypothetical protein
MNNYILSIDPGNVLSAYVVLDNNLRPIEFAKIDNYNLKNILGEIINRYNIKNVAIEHVASMGMAVGQTIFTTCIWIGRFTETLSRHVDIVEIKEIYRREEKINLCGSMKAKDGNIRQALIDRFGIVGVKANKGWFYGVSKDVWSAIAVGVTYHDMYIKKAVAV